MEWLKMRSDLLNDQDVAKIACATGLDEFGVVGRLQHVWSWASQSADGRFAGITPEFIDRLARCEGFADAMMEVGWLNWDGTTLVFPEWDQHLSVTARSRAGESLRRKSRRRRAPAPDSCPVPLSESDSESERPFRSLSDTEKPDGPEADGGAAPRGATAGRPAEGQNRIQKPPSVPAGAVEAVRATRESHQGIRRAPAGQPGGRLRRYDAEQSVFRKMDDGCVRDPATVAEWFRWHFHQTELPRLQHLRETQDDLVKVLAAARHAARNGRSPRRLFATIVGRGDFSRIQGKHLQAAARQAAALSAGQLSGSGMARVG